MEKYTVELTAEEICLIRNGLISAMLDEEKFFGNRIGNKVEEYKTLIQFFEKKKKEIYR